MFADMGRYDLGPLLVLQVAAFVPPWSLGPATRRGGGRVESDRGGGRGGKGDC